MERENEFLHQCELYLNIGSALAENAFQAVHGGRKASRPL